MHTHYDVMPRWDVLIGWISQTETISPPKNEDDSEAPAFLNGAAGTSQSSALIEKRCGEMLCQPNIQGKLVIFF